MRLDLSRKGDQWVNHLSYLLQQVLEQPPVTELLADQVRATYDLHDGSVVLACATPCLLSTARRSGGRQKQGGMYFSVEVVMSGIDDPSTEEGDTITLFGLELRWYQSAVPLHAYNARHFQAKLSVRHRRGIDI